MNTKRKALVVGLAAAVLPLAACSVATQPDEQALVYDAGSFSNTEFEKYVGPSQRTYYGPGDQEYTYPAGQRTVTFDDTEQADFAPFTAPSKDGITLVVSGSAPFELTMDPDRLRQFHEQVGIKARGEAGDGYWDRILDTYLRVPFQRAVSDATSGFNWVDLYQNPEAKAAWEKRIKELLPGFIGQQAGAEYFEVGNVTVQKPEIPAELQKALTDAQVAVQQNEAQKNRNAQIITEIQSIEALVRVLGADGYNVYQAIKDGRVQIMPVPQGSSVVVAPR